MLDWLVEIRRMTADDEAAALRQVVEKRIEHLATDCVVGDIEPARIFMCQYLWQIFVSIVDDSIAPELLQKRYLVSAASDTDDMTAGEFRQLHHEVTDAASRS